MNLSLHERAISHLDDKIMCKLTQFTHLRGLNLAGNQISTLPESFAQLKSLEKLDLSRNPLKDISVVKKLPNLN